MSEPNAVHPGPRTRYVCEGTVVASCRPWTMAQRAELRPRVAELTAKAFSLRGGALGDLNLSDLFLEAEEELTVVVQQSVKLCRRDDPSVPVPFGELLWEDLPVLAQLVWEVCVLREDGGGLAGKLVSLVAPVAASLNQAMAEQDVAAEEPVSNGNPLKSPKITSPLSAEA